MALLRSYVPIYYCNSYLYSQGHLFQIIIMNRKKWWEWHYSFILSRPHEHGHFWPFFTIQRQGIEQTTNLLFILKFLRCSNNQMQKMTSITPSIYETIHKKVFFKNFDHYEGFSQNYQRPGPFTAIPSICNQRSLTQCSCRDITIGQLFMTIERGSNQKV